MKVLNFRKISDNKNIMDNIDNFRKNDKVGAPIA